MFLTSLIITLTIVVFLNVVALTRKGKNVGISAALSGGLSLFGCVLYQSITLSLTLLLVAVFGLVCGVVGARPRWFAFSSIATIAVVYTFVGWNFNLREVQRWEQEKEKYPLESLDDRLAYEFQPRPVRPFGTASANPQVLASLEGALNEENSLAVWERVLSLERLHAGAVRQFIDAEGFGFGRLHTAPMYLKRSTIGTDEAFDEPIRQPASPHLSLDPPLWKSRAGGDTESKPHFANVLHFANPLDFGLVRDRQHVAGFRPHAFHKDPTAPGDWHIERLELVSILKHEEPVVYVTPNFPRMKEVVDHPTRPLDAFEKESLAALNGGKDVMVQEDAARSRMFGSIRAVKQCLKCHSVERGELLGAFSYQMSR